MTSRTPDRATSLATLRAIGRRPVWQITPPQDFRDQLTSDPAAFNLPAGMERPGMRGATPTGGYPLSDHGGSTIKHPQLALVYLGPWWGDTAKLEQFAAELMAYGYLAPLAAYGSGNGELAGAFKGPSVTGSVTDAQLQGILQGLIANPPSRAFPMPDGHILYALLLPDGVTVSLGGTDTSCAGFCGYHDALDAQTFYTVQPSTKCTGCNVQDPFTAFTMVLAHEVAEACTDAVPDQGWFNDETGMEDADEWAWIPKSYGPWTVQGYQVNGQGNTVGAYNPPAKPVPVTDAFWQWLVADGQYCLTEPETIRAQQAQIVRHTLDQFYPSTNVPRRAPLPPLLVSNTIPS